VSNETTSDSNETTSDNNGRPVIRIQTPPSIFKSLIPEDSDIELEVTNRAIDAVINRSIKRLADKVEKRFKAEVEGRAKNKFIAWIHGFRYRSSNWDLSSEMNDAVENGVEKVKARLEEAIDKKIEGITDGIVERRINAEIDRIARYRIDKLTKEYELKLKAQTVEIAGQFEKVVAEKAVEILTKGK